MAVVLMAAERTVTVRLALDASAFAEELSRVANILRLAGVVIADPSVTDDEPVDRTGLCDHCDKPQTGGAAGGGISPEHWCDDHRPADWPGSFDDVADDSAPDDEHPASVGQVPLLLDVARAHSAWIDADEDYRPLAETVVGVVRERLSQYQGSTPISQVFTDWFGGDRG